MSGDVVPLDAQLAQRRAADPAASVWVSANAGAGKTKVLTDRVIRLLLAGSPPSRILCLTFTKAAAAEMTVRVFRTLGDWAALPDAALAAALEALTGEPPSPALQARARRLFARAVETPGGLKIETIHAFCERVLHLVPFEANVPPRFAVLDESQADELMAEARGRVLADAASRAPRFRRLTAALEIVAAEAPGDRLLQLLRAAVADETAPDGDEAIDAAARRLAKALGLRPGDMPEAVKRAMLADGLSPDDRRAIAAALRRTGKPTDASQADLLDQADAEGTLDGRLAAYRAVFFTDEGEPRKRPATASAAQAVRDRLGAEQERLIPLAERLRAAETLERTDALWALAAAVREGYVALKRRFGALDFADLIRKTLDLFERGQASWVLYRLDRGVDHVLIDEAQDTNPDQWRILRRLTEEFTAGAGRPTRDVRTVFAVGDPKQSIYSFQGADPRWFEMSRTHWQTRTRAAELTFRHERLSLSFRSAALVLKTVDRTFAVPAHYRGLSFEDGAVGTTHEAVRQNAPGHIEIWPTETRGERGPDPDAWALPVDMPDERSPAVQTANRIAKAVAAWTRPAGDKPARWRPRDILILVRKRGPAFFGVIRALKAAGVPVAGADRFDIGEHIAVNDLVAAGSAALLPANDLALAAALKSPLVGLDDDDLIRLAADRGEAESLAAALERQAPDDDAAARACAALAQWRELASREGPFGFYVALLGPLGGRRQLVARLGGEAADAIDAFLCYAQTAERGPEAPSLTTFLARFEKAAHTIKRDLDAAGDEVKVMTVHGAKGLEAPVVVVVDGCDVHGLDPKLIPLPVGRGEDTLPVWSPRKDDDCAAVAAARDAARDRALEEHNRLLYVAMTRARDWLVVAPFCTAKNEPAEAWCRMIRHGFADATDALVRTTMPYGEADIVVDRLGSRAPPESEAHALRPTPVEPDWLHAPVGPEPADAGRLRPSDAVRPPSRVPQGSRRGVARAAARRRGVLVHALIEHLADLPVDERRPAAEAWLAARTGSEDAAGAVEAALAVIEHDRLRPLFEPGSRGEAALAGRIGSAEVSGQADRIAIGPDGVLVADFKTGAPGPDGPAPAAYLAQLGLYEALLRDLHPDKPVRALLVWTDGPTVVEPSPDALAAARQSFLDREAASSYLS